MKRLLWGMVIAVLAGSVTVHAQGVYKSGAGSNHAANVTTATVSWSLK
jgi:hypothetical protein